MNNASLEDTYVINIVETYIDGSRYTHVLYTCYAYIYICYTHTIKQKLNISVHVCIS